MRYFENLKIKKGERKDDNTFPKLKQILSHIVILTITNPKTLNLKFRQIPNCKHNLDKVHFKEITGNVKVTVTYIYIYLLLK